MMNSKEDETEKSDEIVPSQYAVSLYRNDQGDAVFMREAFDWESTDNGKVYLVIPRFYVPQVIERLRSIFAELS